MEQKGTDRDARSEIQRFSAAESGKLFSDFPFGLLVVDPTGRAVLANSSLVELLGPSMERDALPASCCDLICSLVDPELSSGCLADQANSSSGPPAELRVDLESSDTSVWVTAAPTNDGDGSVVFHLRPAIRGERRRRVDPGRPDQPMLRVHALGRTLIDSSEGPITREWLDQRPAQLLKFLVCHRSRTPQIDEIVEALWSEGEPTGRESSVRYLVHSLRTTLEPERSVHGESAFIVARRGGYALNRDRVWLDVDEFERSVRLGLSSLADQDPNLAADRLESALKLFRDDFLDEERYAEWAIPERERLRELAGRALTALVEIKAANQDLEAAAAFSRRLADLEPFDSEGQRQHLEICLMRGRRTEAMRRYTTFRRRMIREFGAEPDFKLDDLIAGG